MNRKISEICLLGRIPGYYVRYFHKTWPILASSFHYVLSVDFVDDWKALIAPTRLPLAQFHAKFWEVADTDGEQKDENNMEIDDSTAEDTSYV